MKTKTILDIPIFAESKNKALQNIQECLSNKKSNLVATVNAEFMVEAEINTAFKKILQSSYINLPDGISVRAAGWILKNPLTNITFVNLFILLFRSLASDCKIIFNQKSLNVIPETISGSDLFWDIIELGQKNKLSIYFLGSTENVLKKVIEKTINKYPNIQIAGYSWAKSTENNLAESIAKTKPDILLVAFGSPKQELFLYNNAQIINYKLGIGLGGTFDFIAGYKKRAPKTWQNIGMEWLWRLIHEPSRFHRIIKAVFIFPWIIFKKNLKKSEV